jgi:hypothetical protein
MIRSLPGGRVQSLVHKAIRSVETDSSTQTKIKDCYEEIFLFTDHL